MAENVRELLHDSAPQPTHRPDFDRLWEHGRRQRRTSRFAGALGGVVVLVVAGLGLAELAATPPGPVEVADLPDRTEPSPSRGEDFGAAETPAGVPYVGRLEIRVTPLADRPTADDQEVCVTLRTGPQGERSSTRGCGPLDDYLRRNRPLYTAWQPSALTAVAAWTPQQIDHAIWLLPDGDRRIDVSDAPNLPGSVFVTAIDFAVKQTTSIELYDTDGVRVDTITIEVDDDASADDQPLLEEDGDLEQSATPEDEQLIAALRQFAKAPGPDTAAAIPFVDKVAIGLGPEVHQERASEDLADADAWTIEMGLDGGESFRGVAGQLSALPLLADANAENSTVTVGDHPHCGSPPVPPPEELAELRRISIQPAHWESCLQWWTVDLFVTDDGRIAGLTHDLWEP